MVRLKDRTRQIPNGLRMYLPEAKWKSGSYPSFSALCGEVWKVVRANPGLAAQHKWPATREGVEEWVDQFNATICAQMGWSDYIITDAAPVIPKAPAPTQATQNALAAAAAKARLLVGGAKALKGWLDSGEPAVDSDTSAERARICSQCVHNTEGDWTAWFTRPVSELIKRDIEKLSQRKLTTERDAELGVCDVCFCPLKLKVHTPIAWITKELPTNILEKLKGVPNCWVGR